MMKITFVVIPLVFMWSLTCLADSNEKSEKQIREAVTVFYSSYLKSLEDKNLKESKAEQKKILKKYLSPEFNSKFQKLSDGMDMDPVLLAQDWGADFKDEINISELKIEGSSNAQVKVTLGKLPQGQKSIGPSQLKVDLVKINRLWKIDSISLP